jgi:hypothetical protein
MVPGVRVATCRLLPMIILGIYPKNFFLAIVVVGSEDRRGVPWRVPLAYVRSLYVLRGGTLRVPYVPVN